MVNVVEETKDKPNQLDKFGEAPLCIAAHNGKGFVVENLLQQSNIKAMFLSSKDEFRTLGYRLTFKESMVEPPYI